MALTPASSTSPRVTIRAAAAADAEAIAAIHNEGIADRVATFDTEPRPVADVREQIEAGGIFLVAEHEDGLAGFVSVAPYSRRDVYAGIGEFTVYVARSARRLGVGGALMDAVAAEAERRGLYKLTGLIFTSNRPSIEMLRRRGYREVGVHVRHGRLEGEWKDVLQMERLLGDAAAE